MTTTYEELLQEEAHEISQFHAYGNECAAVAREVLEEVRLQTGWPEECLKRLADPEPLPENIGRGLHGGWFEPKGRYACMVGVKLANVSFERKMRVLRQDGVWFVGLGDREAVPVDRAKKESVAPVVEMLVAIARESIAYFYPQR